MAHHFKSVIEMAIESGLQETFYIKDELERFAALVREDEREACAKVCDEFGDTDCVVAAPQRCAAAIRSRSA